MFEEYSFLNGGIDVFFKRMFAEIDKNQHNQKLKDAGVVFDSESGNWGVPHISISFSFSSIDFVFQRFYVCTRENETTFELIKNIYDNNGEFLFSSTKGNFEYLNSDTTFLIRNSREENYSLFLSKNEPLSEPVFRPLYNSKFSKDSEFCKLGYKNFSDECVINKKGEIVYQKKGFDSLYVYGNIVSDKNHFINLFTNEIICESNHKTLKTGNLMFVESNGQVFKIDTITCEFETFGEANKRNITNYDTPKDKTPTPEAETLPKVIKQSRNDLCNCGSGKKFKNCCGI